MIKLNKNHTLAALSATSMLFVMGAGKAHAAGNIGEVTASSLNVRSGPSTSNSIIGGLKRGAKVDIISSEDGWYKIAYRNTTGWVSGDYVAIKSSDDTSIDKPSTTNKKLISTASLNVRSGGSTSYKIIGYIGKNKTVEMLGVASSGWYQVKLNDGTVGYASNKYLKVVDEAGNDSSNDNTNNETTNKPSDNTNNGTTNKPNDNVTDEVVQETLVATANLNLRVGPSTSNGIIGLVSKGHEVSVLERTTDSWYKVKTSTGRIGYCSAKYLKSQSQLDSATNKPSSADDIAYTLNVKAYAYHTGTITATGTTPTFGRTIAVDPTIIPYGTRIYIPEFDKTFIAEDCGGGIKGNKIDIFMNTREDCINWGVRNITLYILK